MAKQGTTLGLVLPLRNPAIPAYRWLYSTLRTEILEGRLRPGTKIPATRDLAEQYKLSRGTIVAAYEQLKSEGYIEGRIGSGTCVSHVLPEELLQLSHSANSVPMLHQKRKPVLSDYANRVKLFPGYEMRSSGAFRANLPALDLFPIDLWLKTANHILRHASTFDLMGCDSLGYIPLREWVATYLKTSRGVNCEPNQIAIVSGVQEALDLIARILINPGDRVCMENPGYPGAAISFESSGARICAISVDDQGMQRIHSKLHGAKLIYVTPGHQFPLGITMTLPRRLELLDFAQRTGAWIVEDDYDSEFRYSGHPIPSLQGLDRHGIVLFTGSFSKVLFPSLRLGYLVIPHNLIDSFAAVKSITSRHTALLDQAILCDFIAKGHFWRHIRRMREIYAERLGVLLEEAGKQLKGLLEISSIEAGLQTTGWLGHGIHAEEAFKYAAARKVEVTPLSRYSRTRMSREGLQLGFAAITPREIRRGVQDLVRALEECIQG